MRTSTTLKGQMQQTIAEILGVASDVLSEESSPESIASWDSLTHLNLVLALENEFRVSLSADDVLEMRNVGLVSTVLRKHGVEI